MAKVQTVNRGDKVVEAKVKTTTLAAGAVGLVLSLLSHFVGGEVPTVLAGSIETAVTTLVTGGVTFAAGWVTKHTPLSITAVKDEQ